jgi:CPA1 family monovalent cation:H+ antiporter
MLALLLFAGALHIKLDDLRRQRLARVAALSTVGVGRLHRAWVGAMTLLRGSVGLGIHPTFINCLLFGRADFPNRFRSRGRSASLRYNRARRATWKSPFAGESLFQYERRRRRGGSSCCWGVAAQAARCQASRPRGPGCSSPKQSAGWSYGFGNSGLLGYRLLKTHRQLPGRSVSPRDRDGGYALASVSHISAPIAIARRGLLIGNHGRATAMSDLVRERSRHLLGAHR